MNDFDTLRDGDEVSFEYNSKFRGTFAVTGTVIEADDETLRFEAETETGPGIDEPPANWTGRLEQKDGYISLWAEAQFVGNDDHLKGSVA